MRFLLVILSVAIASANSEKIQARIINGFAVKAGEIPYIVSIAIRKNEAIFWCGGSIIGNTWILTAAHCTENVISVLIFYGSIKLGHGTVKHLVLSKNFIQHPEYISESNHNDIALIRTPHVDFTNLIMKIELADRENSYMGEQAIACGYGHISNDGATSENLLCAELNVISNDECSKRWDNIVNTQLCIGPFGYQTTCKGDSGGPLVSSDDNKLIGITSYGSKCDTGEPAVFTRLSAYLDWIHSNTQIV